MTVEQRTLIRPAGLTLLGRIWSAVIASFRAWRAERAERMELEALEALGPEILDDIGVRIIRTDNPPKPLASCNPHLIAAMALGASKRGRDER
ncbi:hypothetical protein [Taklimakanibacter lacteus]|uniref:hypothetical protein n=1 Tax=Taklimakanibacter lacteus TaxID=2268456 RepID=UPI000E66A83F